MKVWVFLLIVPLSGCMAGVGVDDVHLDTSAFDAVKAGQAYQFRHEGGPLRWSIAGDGSAAITLYDGDDRRVGRVELGIEAGVFEMTVPAGELVVHVHELTAALRVDTDHGPVAAVEPLRWDVARHVLIQRPSFGAQLDPSPVDESVQLDLGRAPAELRLLSDGSFDGLKVIGYDEGRLAFESASSFTLGPDVFAPAFGMPMRSIQMDVHEANLVSGNLVVDVEAVRFDGTLLLEVVSYSRALPVVGLAEPTPEVPEFIFGDVESTPVSFEVPPAANGIFLIGGEKNGSVLLFDGDDQRLGVFAVPAGSTLRLEASAGDYVAVHHAGATVAIGLDAVPGDFEFHILRETTVTHGRGERGDTYEQGTATLEPAGIPYRLSIGPSELRGLPRICFDDTWIRATQHGESIASATRFEDAAMDDGGRLTTAPVNVAWSVPREGCDSLQATLHGYVRA